jgi:phosphoribosylformylglycinamidine cyclo-ligase
VGTKLKVALMAGVHHTVGQDLVNHCVNDILVQGARPLFFMDYAAFGKLDPKVLESVVSGFARACRQNGCGLIGGETAEMPGMYARGDYDLAGFIVGAVEKKKLVTGRSIRPEDVVIGLATNGLQTNGYSLARRILFDKQKYEVNTRLPELGLTVGEALLRVHPSFLKPVAPLLDRGLLKGMAHITGGGFLDNIPRVLPNGCAVAIAKGSWPVLPIFDLLKRLGRVPEDDMYRTFNMGIGFVLIVSPRDEMKTMKMLKRGKTKAYVIGRVVEGDRRVILL